MQKYKSRQEVPDKYKWDLTEICKDINEYNQLFDKAKNEVEKASSYKGCTKDSNKLYEFLDYDANLSALLIRLNIYAYVINDQELGNSENMDRLNKIEDLFTKYMSNVSFFNDEILSLSDDDYKALYDNKKLDEYKYTLDNIYRLKEHILPSEKEIIINELTNAAMNYENMSQTMLNSLNNYGTVKVGGEEEKILQTNLRRLMKNDDKEIRKEVRSKYYEVLKQYAPMSASLLNSYVKTNITTSKIHGYKDAWDAKLFGNKMPNEAYVALVSAVEENLDVLHKYYNVFKDTLKVDELDQCDLALDFVKYDKEYSIEDAQEICLNAIKPLGEDYYNHFKKIFDKHYIDYACYPGKCSGGYSISGLDFDSRILMSWNYDIESVSTVIHEGGHNVHGQYINENNPLQYRDVSSLISEVASLTNECLLSSYLAENGRDNKEKLKGIENILGVIVSNLFGAVREGKMEQDFYDYVNEGNTITSDYMESLTKEYLDKYQGGIVNKDDYYGLSWISRSHYYMNYYLYAYAMCISIASYVASEILNGNKEMLDNYIKFLSTGTDHDYPDVFKVLGIDITDKNVYIKAIEYFNSMLDRFVELNKEEKV
ncbi:MAG: hypothetical protein IKP76_00740 [Bacilli bacterium]|nr:hypothetical protein [Bacilli bacterium]